MEKSPTIYQKLLTIQKRIVGLGKDKDGHNYRYVTGTKVLGEIKPMMNDLGLILKQEVLSIENTRQDYATKFGAKSEILSKVMMRFTWVDCETGETDENLFGANGQNDWDKGCGSAFTYAERYFLLKYFHIATDEDDIDNPDRQKTLAEEPKKEKSAPAPALSTLLPNTKQWKGTAQKLADGITIDEVKKYFIISNENAEILMAEAMQLIPSIA